MEMENTTVEFSEPRQTSDVNVEIYNQGSYLATMRPHRVLALLKKIEEDCLCCEDEDDEDWEAGLALKAAYASFKEAAEDEGWGDNDALPF